MIEHTRIMGVVNVTPDSFSDGGHYFSLESAVAHALRLVEEGADLLDLGAESSRPGAYPISASEELGRLRPILQALAGRIPIPISVDTTKPEIADAALRLGASMINDITGGTDPGMLEVVSRHGASLVIMHMRANPRTMQDDTAYRDVVAEVSQFLQGRVEAARLPESIGAVCAAAMSGANYVRVHDVAECHRALAIVDAIRGVPWTAS